ncbi:MAG: 5-formyltetrahydrofolate cyclo-ligase [Clostridia bacterium]|nr:5-formyltetrahydrofolate cyclo-ligase [Clostridia bacterium]
MPDKTQARKIIRERLSALSEDEKSRQSDNVFSLLKSLDLPDGSICIYNSICGEVDTKEIIEYFIGKRKVYLPVVDGEDMSLVEVDADTEYRIAKWGILEPTGKRLLPEEVNPAITVTPLLGADKDLNRLGKGKGYYDRYFAKVDTLKIGLAFDSQIVEKIPCEDTDKALDILISASGILRKDRGSELRQ